MTNIAFAQTNLFSNLILDYLKQDENVKSFYHYAPTIDAIEQIIQDKKQENIDRKILVETIKNQYSKDALLSKSKDALHASQMQASTITNDACNASIQLLENENTFCIVTAHQLNIFGGPLYFIYKIAQTISTCRQLKEKFPSYNFVPVFWLGSEDHDFEEINHVYLYNNKVEWNDKQGGATGEYLTESILPSIEEIKTILNIDDNNELIILLKTAYAESNLTNDTRYLVNALFGEYGLVVVDGNDKTFKQQFSSIMKDELLQHNAVKLATEQIAQLEAKGYKQQAFPRDINLFYLRKNSRERIVKENSEFRIQNTELKFTESEILQELENYPERFSPNVILRPLMQQKTLPSLAYIGGAGELSYWLQLKLIFDFYKVNFPQLLLRNSAMIVNGNIAKKIEKIGFQIQDFFSDIDTLKKEFIAKNTDEDIDVTAYKNEVESTFVKLQDLVKNIDASLVNTVGADLQKTLHSIDAIQKRLMKSLKQKNEIELHQIEKIKSQLFPLNNLQERVENFSVYYAKYGQTFIENLIRDFDVYNKQFLIINN